MHAADLSFICSGNDGLWPVAGCVPVMPGKKNDERESDGGGAGREAAFATRNVYNNVRQLEREHTDWGGDSVLSLWSSLKIISFSFSLLLNALQGQHFLIVVCLFSLVFFNVF